MTSLADSDALPVSVPGAATVRVHRVRGGAVDEDDDQLAVEEPLLLELVHDRDGGRVTESVAVTMRTPGNDHDLALGFLFTEGIVRRPDEIGAIEGPAAAGRPDANTVRVALRPGVPVDVRRLERHFYTTSSCGVCGKTSLDALAATAPPPLPPDAPVVNAAVLHALPAALRAAQPVFHRTGGLHAAALFAPDGALVLLREDVGRHNAVDKLAGARLAAAHVPPFAGHLLLVSGRASWELVQKAVAGGAPLLAAVGAPSSLAVEGARAHGMTLVGFLRDDRFNVYAAPGRVRALADH